MGPQERLNDYLAEVSTVPFEWGVHDCLTFTNGAWHRMYGHGWADDWLGRYFIKHDYGIRLLRKDQLRSEFGFFSFEEAIDLRLSRVGHVPPRCSLVASKGLDRFGVGYALGVCCGASCAFLSRTGVVYKPVDQIEKAWVQ